MTDGPMPDLIEGDDYYLENGLMVFTEGFLRRRGYCCESGCRHCPWGFKVNRQMQPIAEPGKEEEP